MNSVSTNWMNSNSITAALKLRQINEVPKDCIYIEGCLAAMIYGWPLNHTARFIILFIIYFWRKKKL